MHVVQVVHGFPPFQNAGAELFAHGLSRALVRRGARVTVFHRMADDSRPEYAVERAEVDGLPVVRVNNTFRERDRFELTYRNDAIDAVFGKLLDRDRPDVVHFQHVTCLSTNLVAEAHRRGIPVVFTLHDYWLICQRGQFLKRDLSQCGGQEDSECVKCLAWQLNLRGGTARVASALKHSVPAIGSPRAAGIKRLLKGAYNLYAELFFSSQAEARDRVRERMEHVKEICGKVDRFVAPSRFLEERFREFGVPAARIVHLRYGFDTSYYGAERQRTDAGIRFGYLGTWIPSKGVHVLVEAFNGIRDERANLHIYGHAVPYEGHENYLDHLKGLIRNPRVQLEGFYENDQVGRILADLDVLVVPSIWYENSPLTIQEAFLAGVPVITAEFGGMRELVRDGENGLTFRPRDAADLRRQMERVLAEPGLLETLRPRPDSVKTIDRSAEEHLALYDGLLGERARAPALEEQLA